MTNREHPYHPIPDGDHGSNDIAEIDEEIAITDTNTLSQQDIHPTSLEIVISPRSRIVFVSWCSIFYIIIILAIANTTSIILTKYFDGQLQPSFGKQVIRIPVQVQGNNQLAQEAMYPNCKSMKLSMIGNGFCDVDLNIPECNFDNGDCIKFNKLFPKCITQHPDSIFDNWCDLEHNNEECGYDNGACKAFHEKYEGKCDVKYPSLLGNGVCDEHGGYNTENCDWDGGDCQDNK